MNIESLSAKIKSLCYRLFHRERIDSDLDAEIQSALALLTEQKIAQGMSPGEGRRAAIIELGGVEQVKEKVRAVRTGAWLDSLLQDTRFAARMLRKNPGFTVVAVLTLALGIGANTAIFSLVDAVMLRSLPVREPQALVLLGPGDQSGNSDDFPKGEMHLFSYPMYRDINDDNRVFGSTAAFRSGQAKLNVTLRGSTQLESIAAELVSANYFDVLGVRPLIGRSFSSSNDQKPDPVVVINYDWWNRRFAKDPAVIGKTLTISDTVYTIIGVAPPGFFGTTVGRSPDVWLPLQMNDAVFHNVDGALDDKSYRFLDIIGRLKSGVTRAQASANVNLVFKNILRSYVGSTASAQRLDDISKVHISLYSGAAGNSLLRQRFSKPLWTLMIIVGLVLLITCANIANLLLARGKAREREIAVRSALGAGRRRLICQLLTEGFLLAVTGGALGVAIAFWGCRFFVAMISQTQSALVLDASPNLGVLTFTVAVSVGCALLFGSLPAVRSTAIDAAPALKTGRGAAAGDQRDSFAKALIASQVALSLVLLVAAGLFIRTLTNLTDVNTGFTPQGVLLFKVDPSATGYMDWPRLQNMYQEIESRVDALPAVTASSFSIFNFYDGSWDDSAWAEGESPSQPVSHDLSLNAVGSHYFAAIGIPILAGRAFSPEDTATSPRVAVINETMAKRLFPGASPIGKRFGGDPSHSSDAEVVGVVSDAKYYSLDEGSEMFAYFPYTQYKSDWGIGLYLSDFEVRYVGDSQATAAAVRRIIGSENAGFLVDNVRTLTDKVDVSIILPRLTAELSAFFGVLAVLLACIGIYGLSSYSVNRRTSEIGIRMALGAQRGDVLGMVMWEALKMVLLGVAAGIPLALAGSRWAASILYGLKPYDPITLLGGAVLLLVVALLAGFLPARRATRVDPVSAMRCE